MAEIVALTLRLPGPMHLELVERARAERRSLNEQIVWTLQQALSPLRGEREKLKP